VLAAKAALTSAPDDVLIIFGDTPLIRPQTLMRMREALAGGAAVVVLGFRHRIRRLWPAGARSGELVAIREESTASPPERALNLCNGGLMAFAGATALAILERIGDDNRKAEYYLTDAVASPGPWAQSGRDRDRGGRLRGINTRRSLPNRSRAAAALRGAAMEAGVTSWRRDGLLVGGHQVRRDVVVEPFVCSDRRHDRGRCRDPFVLAPRPRACGQGRNGRPIRAVAPRCALHENVHIGISSRSRRR